MDEKRIIAVVGATGAQGSGLCRAILNDKGGGFRVRALTRNPGSDKAKELAKLGAEVVAADVDDEKSLEKAFRGAYGAFCVTFFWEHFSPEKEYAHASAMAHAAKNAGVKHVIWSTLEDTRRWVPLSDDRMPTLMGKYKVPHFDAKGEADRVFTDLGLPVTFLPTSFYWENLIYFGMGPKRGADGKLEITFPMGDKKLPGVAAEDIGKCAYAIFKNGNEFIGKTVGIAGEHLTGMQMADALTKALGREVRYKDMPPEVYRGLGFPGAEDLGNMFQFKRDFENVFCGAREVGVARSLNPSLQTFQAWLAVNKNRIPIEKESRRAAGE
ncbi:MAG TPA: NmrA/HSCARG family protein [Candidatus Limnocylindria bacterium]|nr:NmrA/HSCARG family protein [Candidatus Limnocylindria bacterium]